MQQVHLDTLTPKQRKAFDAWMQSTGFETQTDIHDACSKAANVFLAHLANYVRTLKADPAEPSPEELLEYSHEWLKDTMGLDE